MAVTELALLRLSLDTPITSPSLLAGLFQAKKAMEASSTTKQPFLYYHCIKDPSLIYIIGSWSSVSAHLDDFIPSAANQECLMLLKDQLKVEWMFHLDIDAGRLPTSEKILCIGRHFVKEGERQTFQETFNENRKGLDGHIGEKKKVVGGWRIDKDTQDCETEGEARIEKEEFVLFTGWESREQHFGFAKTDGFERYGRIRDFLEGAEIMHAVKMEVGV